MSSHDLIYVHISHKNNRTYKHGPNYAIKNLSVVQKLASTLVISETELKLHGYYENRTVSM